MLIHRHGILKESCKFVFSRGPGWGKFCYTMLRQCSFDKRWNVFRFITQGGKSIIYPGTVHEIPKSVRQQQPGICQINVSCVRT